MIVSTYWPRPSLSRHISVCSWIPSGTFRLITLWLLSPLIFYFIKFISSHERCSFEKAVQAWKLKRHSNMGAFQWILWNFQEQLFLIISVNSCFFKLAILVTMVPILLIWFYWDFALSKMLWIDAAQHSDVVVFFSQLL